MIANTAQDTINKWIGDGMTKEEAIGKWQSIMRIPLPDIIRPFIKDIRYDFIRELNLDDKMLLEKEGNNV